jgi:hypothetical protein
MACGICVVGFGCRSVNTCYVNGKPMPVGYLSSLRLLREHRNLGLIARGSELRDQLELIDCLRHNGNIVGWHEL